jgi:acetylornithine/N-succinyldiaminopimelate aminotransferase
LNTQEIMNMNQQYVMQTYGRLPIALVKGQGAKVWDAEGKEYYDFVSGLAVVSLGHSHPAVTKTISEQAANFMHCSNLYYIENQVKLAKFLVENSFGDKVFFCNSGAEANEGAIKIARKYAKMKFGKEKFSIISAEKSFHGRTIATVTATGQPKFKEGFEPLPKGFRYVPYNDFEALKASITKHTCGIILEPVQGEGGVNVADVEYLQQVRQLCDELNILLIFDEVQCGLGRTGKLFAYEHYGIEPDIMTLAKALGNGFPVGALIATDKVAAAFQPGDHGTTFGGNPLASAVALTVLETMVKDDIIANTADVGGYFYGKLQELANKYDFITEVRGKGLILAMELNIEGREIMLACQDKGLLINVTQGNILRFIPPLIITKVMVDEAVYILEQALNEVGV